jgi:3',5'-cyclic AMP phosphodiesterase CpdA
VPPFLQFALQPREQPLPFTWVHGTDCHVPRGGEDKFRDFRKDLEAHRDKWAFCVLSGDLVDLADSHPPQQAEAEFEFFQRETTDFPLPLFCLPGNHDIAGIRAKAGWTGDHPLYGYRGFTRVVGPLRWSFTHADVHFVGLDFNQWNGKAWTLGVPASAVEWLAEDLRPLAKGTRVFVFAHFLSNSEPLDAFLAARPVDAVFVGHGHQDLRTEVHGIPVFESGSLSQIFGKGGEPIGYRLVHVEPGGFRTEYRATGAAEPGTP